MVGEHHFLMLSNSGAPITHGDHSPRRAVVAVPAGFLCCTTLQTSHLLPACMIPLPELSDSQELRTPQSMISPEIVNDLSLALNLVFEDFCELYIPFSQYDLVLCSFRAKNQFCVIVSSDHLNFFGFFSVAPVEFVEKDGQRVPSVVRTDLIGRVDLRSLKGFNYRAHIRERVRSLTQDALSLWLESRDAKLKL